MQWHDAMPPQLNTQGAGFSPAERITAFCYRPENLIRVMPAEEQILLLLKPPERVAFFVVKDQLVSGWCV